MKFLSSPDPIKCDASSTPSKGGRGRRRRKKEEDAKVEGKAATKETKEEIKAKTKAKDNLEAKAEAKAAEDAAKVAAPRPSKADPYPISEPHIRADPYPISETAAKPTKVAKPTKGAAEEATAKGAIKSAIPQDEREEEEALSDETVKPPAVKSKKAMVARTPPKSSANDCKGEVFNFSNAVHTLELVLPSGFQCPGELSVQLLVRASDGAMPGAILGHANVILELPNADGSFPTPAPPATGEELFMQLKALNTEETNKDDYFKDGEWDLGGLESDIRMAKDEKEASAGAAGSCRLRHVAVGNREVD